MPKSVRPGDVLADRYRLVDLLVESGTGRFWRAQDRVLERHVALHVLDADDDRASGLLEAARQSATVPDRRLLRVLDADRADGVCYVVNEWGSGSSLDVMLATDGPLAPRRAAWVVAEVAASVAIGHEAGVAHGRLVPENVLVDRSGSIRVIGFSVDAALHGLPPGRTATDVRDLGGLLYCALTGRWPGESHSDVPAAPHQHGRVLRPRQVRAGIPRPLDQLCDQVVNPYAGPRSRDGHDLGTAQGIADYLSDFVGDPTGLAEAEVAGHTSRGRVNGGDRTVVFPAVPASRPGSTGPGTPAATGQQEAPEDPPTDGPPEDATQVVPAADPAADATAEPREEPAAEERTVVVPVPTPDPAPAEPDPEPAVDADAAPVTDPDPDEPAEDEATEDEATGDEATGDEATGDEATGDEPAREEAAEAATDERPASPVEQATQAGLPIFDDDNDDVSWLAARSTPPPPPPPFEEIPERPLFAPEPADGQPARKTRPNAATASAGGRDYWPWDTGTGTGTGTVPVTEEDEDDEVPGRSWLRLAAAIGASLLLLLAVVVAFNLGRGRSPLGGEPEDQDTTSPSASSSATPTAITGLTAQDFDPQGDPPEEHSELAGLAVDGNPSTGWSTMTYTQDLGPGGLKTGVGLVIDLGAVHRVSSVDLTMVGAPTDVSLYVTGQAPTAVGGLTSAASADGIGTHRRITLDQPVRGRFLTVWLTSLPLADGGYRGEVAEVSVRG